jgi:hypothetical protein
MEAMSEWIKHDGKGMPFKPYEKVAVRFRDGDEEKPGPAGMWNYGDGTSSWKHKGIPSDITHYQMPSKAQPETPA